MTILPGPVRQFGYVVTDLDQAIAGWVTLGVGPWFDARHAAPSALPGRTVRGDGVAGLVQQR